jgi:hypothetical protein
VLERIGTKPDSDRICGRVLRGSGNLDRVSRWLLRASD